MNREATVNHKVSLKRRVSWPLIVAALLIGHAGLIIGAAVIAVQGTGRGVVEDYYAQAVDFDTHKAELAASAKLGWALTITPGSLVDEGGQRLMTAALTDRDGLPIPGAQIELRLVRLADGKAQTLQLETVGERTEGGGGYQAVAVLPAAGWYKANAVVQQDDTRFVQQEEIYVVGGAGLTAEEGGS